MFLNWLLNFDHFNENLISVCYIQYIDSYELYTERQKIIESRKYYLCKELES